MGLFRKPTDAYRAGKDVASIESWLRRRAPWKKLPPGILRAIVHNVREHGAVLGDREVAREQGLTEPEALSLIYLVVFCESHDVVRRNFLPLVGTAGPGPTGEDYALGMFAFCLYRWGSMFLKQAQQTQDQQQWDYCCSQSDLAFRGSLLCDPLYLPSYWVMAVLWGTMGGNAKVGLEWCRQYREAEQKLRTTADEQLTIAQQAAKATFDAETSARAADKVSEMARRYPHLLPEWTEPESSEPEGIGELEDALRDLIQPQSEDGV